jgi:hypothetical protein
MSGPAEGTMARTISGTHNNTEISALARPWEANAAR